MMAQANRYIFKLVAKAQKGQSIDFPFTYINKIPDLLRKKKIATTKEHFANLDILEQAFSVRAAYLIHATSAAL